MWFYFPAKLKIIIFENNFYRFHYIFCENKLYCLYNIYNFIVFLNSLSSGTFLKASPGNGRLRYKPTIFAVTKNASSGMFVKFLFFLIETSESLM